MPTLSQASAWYPQADPVHGFDHVQRVFELATRLAEAEGANLEIVQAAALLHDVQGGDTVGGEAGRSDHHLESAAFARSILEKEGWPEARIEAVQHCIRSHRYRSTSERPQTLEAQILFDADKLDVLGAIGVVRTIAYDVVTHQPVYEEPSEKFLKTGEKEPGEGHSSYHEFMFKLRKIKDLLHTQTARTLAEGRHDFLVDFFTQLQAEMRGEK
jgi:uncharacterized protein